MKPRIFLVVLLAVLAVANLSLAQGTAFNYQGKLNSGTNPATGSYDLTFSLFSASSGAGQIGNTITNPVTAISAGLFTVTLDFGANFPAADRWLEIGVRTNGSGAFTILSPRQKILAVPYAIYAGAAGTASVAANATMATTAANFSGALAGDVTGAQSATTVATVGGQTAANVANSVIGVNSATSSSTPNTLVKRDSDGGFLRQQCYAYRCVELSSHGYWTEPDLLWRQSAYGCG